MRSSPRHRLLNAALAAAFGTTFLSWTSLVSAQSSAQAVEPTFNISVPAQPLAAALNELSRQTGAQVLAASEVPMRAKEMIAAMSGLGLKGMASAFDEAVTTGVQRKRTAMEILADLVKAEAAHRQAASIRYRITAAKLGRHGDFPDETREERAPLLVVDRHRRDLRLASAGRQVDLHLLQRRGHGRRLAAHTL